MRSSFLAAALLAAAASPALADPQPAQTAAPAGLRQQVEAILARAPKGTRWGVLVTDANGREIVAIDPDMRFIPASNTKLFTTAAALAIAAGDSTVGGEGFTASLAIEPRAKGAPDIRLSGGGGGSISTAPDCKVRCLKGLIDPIASQWRSIAAVIADDSHFTDLRWSPGMSWNNIGSDDGTATSAIVIDNNEVPIVVTPGAPGQPPGVQLTPYFALVNDARTVAEGKTEIKIERGVNSRVLRLYGTILANAPQWRDDLGLDDPADYAGWLLSRELLARGVKVRGGVKVVHGPLRGAVPPPSPPIKPAPIRPKVEPILDKTLVIFQPGAPLAEEVSLINKDSQNLHAELLIRRLAFSRNVDIFDDPGKASVPANTLESGLAAAREVFEKAGLPRAGYDFSDGSGMSTYNRVSPRAAIALLRWGASQPWGKQWLDSFPIGGVDGTLRRRFAGTPLQGRVFAKTGTLNATNALSGYLVAASGQELTFSIFANDVADGGNAVQAMDEAVLAIAAAN